MIINMNGAKAPETPSSVLQEKTVTPETLPVVIGPDAGYDGLTQVTVNPDAQLIPTNIRSGKTVFGVEGSFVGETTVEVRNAGIGQALTGRFTSYDNSIKVIKAEDWGSGFEAITGYFMCNAKLDLELPHMNQFKDPNNAIIKGQLTSGGYSAIYTLRINDDDVYYVDTYLIAASASNFFKLDSKDVADHFIDRRVPTRFPQVPFVLVDVDKYVIPSRYTSLGYFHILPVDSNGNNRNTTVVIPETIESIGSSFCRYKAQYITIQLLGTTPPTIEYETLPYNLAKIIVPKGSLETYQTANYWSERSNIMEEATQ